MEFLSPDTLDLPIIMPPGLDIALFLRVIVHMPEFHVLSCHQYKQVNFLSVFEIHKIKAAIH
jgi:hypothetical protein